MFNPDPNFSIPDTVKRIPDAYFEKQIIVSKLSEIWSGMFIPESDLDFCPSRIQGSKRHRIRIRNTVRWSPSLVFGTERDGACQRFDKRRLSTVSVSHHRHCRYTWITCCVIRTGGGGGGGEVSGSKIFRTPNGFFPRNFKLKIHRWNFSYNFKLQYEC
jgi:hypothetical protein